MNPERGSWLQSRKAAVNHSFPSRFFSFDQDDVKKLSMSNDSLNKAMEDPVQPEEPTSSEVNVRKRGKRDRERRYSAPPVSERQIRDSVGSIEYLSESQGMCVCLCGSRNPTAF